MRLSSFFFTAATHTVRKLNTRRKRLFWACGEVWNGILR